MPKKIELKNSKNRQKSNSNLDSNEIKFTRRTLDNNTHEVIEDTKIKTITSWRKSDIKFKQNLIFNILSFGILHIISLFKPNLYIKLYCIPWPAKECDFFLVENIYGKLTMCPKIYRKNKNHNINDFKLRENGSPLNDNNIESEYNNIIKHLTYSFEYKSCLYEYDEKNNLIIPIYMNLSKMLNREIYDYFSDGLLSQKYVIVFSERYGKNEYKLNLNILYLFFFKSQIPSLGIVIIIGIIEYINTENIFIIIFKIVLAILIIIIELLVSKISFINKYKNEFTLDGDNIKVKVKRKYMLKNENQLYYNLNIDELLPGDIILLKNDDYVPCDCLIIDGECLVNEINVTGSLGVYKKFSLKNNSDYFSYKYSNINILYHGMKVIKTFSKFNHGYISALCINIGPNTFKANQYSNTLYLLERKNEYNTVYNLFGERKKIFIYIVINLILTVLAAVVYFNLFLGSEYRQSEYFKKHMVRNIIATICKSLMGIFFIIQNILIFIARIKLNQVDLVCFDKSRLIKSGKINTIIFNKTETLSKKDLEIYSYHPVSKSLNKANHIIFKNYLKNQSKDLNKCILDYYQNYLDKNENNIKRNSKSFRKGYKYSINNSSMNNTNFDLYIVMFLECLLCCNSIEKYDMDLFGNDLEIEIFDGMKWDIKQNEENNNNNYAKIKYGKDINVFKENKNIKNPQLINLNYYISKKIIDIFPKNYYKLAQASTEEQINIKNTEPKINKTINNPRASISRPPSSFFVNQIKLDIESLASINSYKLRVYKKFIVNGTLNSASIVYNFITKELRFMIKGNPEEIITRCYKNTLPQDFEKVISLNRKNGFIILVCATKKLDINNYDENDELENYLEDLTFLGFLTLKINIKENVRNSIDELKKFNENFLIISGDNEYNCLSTGFQSQIIENKNIFILDKEDNSKISIKKIYSIKSNNEKEEEKEKDKISKFSRITGYSKITTENSGVTTENIKDTSKNYSYITKNSLLVKPEKGIIKNDDIYLPELNNLGDLDMVLEKRGKKVNEQKGKRNRPNKDLIIGNSEYERIITTGKSINNTTDKKKTEMFKSKKGKTKDNNELIIGKKNTEDILVKEDYESKYLIFMEKYYYQDIFKEYGDVKDGIFCLSGRLLNYLNKNKMHKGVKNFLDMILNKTKIFFNMSSIDKSVIVDYYRESPNNFVCAIGQCDSDIDSILSSDVGINLKSPNNLNTILSHYYSSKNDIICIKDVIMNGRVFFENNILLESISFVSSMVLVGYILCCNLRNVDINQGEINFLELEYFILATLSFVCKTKDNNYLDQNSRILDCYYYIQLGENILFKLLGILLFCYLFKGNLENKKHLLDLEFLSYFFTLSIEFLIGGILSFNFMYLTFFSFIILSKKI